MKIASKDKQRLLDRLTKARIRGLNIAVLRVILGYMQTHGVAFAAYSHYAQGSGYSERTVQRTIRIARDYLILDLASREGRPAIWCPELMNWTADEAVCFVDALTDEFRGCSRNGAKLATPTSSVTPPRPPADVPAPSAATTVEPVPSVTSTTDPHDAPSVVSTTDPAPSAATTADLASASPLHPGILDAMTRNGATPEIIAATWRAASQVAASKLAPDSASKLALNPTPDLAPLN